MARSHFPRDFWVMCLGSLFFFLSFNLVLPELPGHLRKIGGPQYLGWIISSFSICALLARPFSGWVTDMLGRRWAMMGGTAFCIIAGMLYPVAQVVWIFFLIRGLHGFSAGFAPTGLAAFTADIVPKKRLGEALGWQGLFSNLGSSAGYILGAWLALFLGRDGMYFASSAMAIAAMYIFSTLPETSKRAKKHSLHPKNLFYAKSWKSAFLMYLVCVPVGALLTIMPDFTLFSGYKNKGLYLGIYIAFSLLVRITSGKLSDKLGRPYSTAIGSVMQVIALLMLAFIQSPWVFFLSAALYGMGQGFNAPSLFAWAGDVSTEENRGRSMGMLFIALEGGVITGSLMAGEWFTGTLRGYQEIFIFCAMASFLALAASLFFIKKGLQKPLS